MAEGGPFEPPPRSSCGRIANLLRHHALIDRTGSYSLTWSYLGKAAFALSLGAYAFTAVSPLGLPVWAFYAFAAASAGGRDSTSGTCRPNCEDQHEALESPPAPPPPGRRRTVMKVRGEGGPAPFVRGLQGTYYRAQDSPLDAHGSVPSRCTGIGGGRS